MWFLFNLQDHTIMKNIVLLFTVVIVLFIIAINPVYGFIEVKKANEINSPKVCGDRLCSDLNLNELSPLYQFKQGISIDKIQCKSGYELVLKNTSNQPACVKPSSIEKLVDIGWAKRYDAKYSIIEEPMSIHEDGPVLDFNEKTVDKTLLSSQVFIIDDEFVQLNARLAEISGQKAVVFTGTGLRGFHNIDVTISSENGFELELDTKTAQSGELFMPWIIPQTLEPGIYAVEFSDRKSFPTIKIELES